MRARWGQANRNRGIGEFDLRSFGVQFADVERFEMWGTTVVGEVIG